MGLGVVRPGCQRSQICQPEGAPGSGAAGGVIEVRHAKLTGPQGSGRSRWAACSLALARTGMDSTVTVERRMPTADSCAINMTKFGSDRRQRRRQRSTPYTPHRCSCPPTSFVGCVLASWSTRTTGWKPSRWLQCAAASCAPIVQPSTSWRRYMCLTEQTTC